MKMVDLAARSALDAQLKLLSDEHAVTIELDVLADLVRHPVVDPLSLRRSPAQAGVDDLAATLLAARRLPDDLTVRVVIPEDPAPEATVAQVEAALHRCAAHRATVAWRDGMAQRAMGLSQLPLGLALSATTWTAAYAFGYLATEVDGIAVGVLAVSAMVAITIAWVVSWMVVEATILDWRLDARRAAAYELLSRAHVEVMASSPRRPATPDPPARIGPERNESSRTHPGRSDSSAQSAGEP